MAERAQVAHGGLQGLLGQASAASDHDPVDAPALGSALHHPAALSCQEGVLCGHCCLQSDAGLGSQLLSQRPTERLQKVGQLCPACRACEVLVAPPALPQRPSLRLEGKPPAPDSTSGAGRHATRTRMGLQPKACMRWLRGSR